MEKTITDNSIEKIVAILTNANYQHFFGPSSVGEVEVLHGDFRGRIDRLSVVEDKVYILDYKTGAPPQEKNSKTNAVYSLQLKNYREALKALYPDHFIHTFLLWIEGPYLIEVY